MKIYYQLVLLAIFTGITPVLKAQENKSASVLTYRETPTRINDLVHTKLDVRFDYKKRYLYGKEWITLKPHFYTIDSLRLDAKGMDINSISILTGNGLRPLKFTYDSLSINIKLDRFYTRLKNTPFTLLTSPNLMSEKGSATMKRACILSILTELIRTNLLRSGPKGNRKVHRAGSQLSINPIRKQLQKSA